MNGLNLDHKVSVVVEKRSPGDRISTTKVIIHNDGGEPPALGLPRKVSPAHVGQEMAKNAGLMRAVWKGQGRAVAGSMGKQKWIEAWKGVARNYSDDGEDDGEDGGVDIQGQGDSEEGGQSEIVHGNDRGGNLEVDTEHWSDHAWTNEEWGGEDETMDDNDYAQDWLEHSDGEDDGDDGDETADERDQRLDEVMARMGLIEIRRMTPDPFDVD